MKNLIQKNRVIFNKAARYYDLILGNWLSKIQKNALSEIKIKKNARILDAGCGTGNLLMLLSNNKNLKLYGIDISREMLKIARRKLENKAKLRLMPAENLKFKEKFNYIFSTEAFHHFYNQEKAMKNFYNSLEKGGKLVIVDLDFGFILNRIFNWIEPGNSRMFSAKEFENIFKAFKFKNIKQEKLGLFAIMTAGEK